MDLLPLPVFTRIEDSALLVLCTEHLMAEQCIVWWNELDKFFIEGKEQGTLEQMSTSTSALETSIETLELCEYCAGEHPGPCSINNTLVALSTNLRNSLQGTSRWSLSDTTAGLFKVFNLHALNSATDTFVNGAEIDTRNELDEMLEWMRWSYAAYENDKQTLATKLELNRKDLVKMITNSGINKPAFFVGIHHPRKCVVLVVRGTYQTQDILTDLCPHNKTFLQGSAHSGMLGAAMWLFENEGQELQSLLVKHLGYRLVLTGHSMGAAIACLLAMKIRATNRWFMPKQQSKVSLSETFCWGYGCAPCVDRMLAESSNYICNVVLQDDIVARLTPAAVEVLRNEIQATSWSEVVQDERAKKVLETIGHIQGSILSTGAQAGAALFQTIDNIRTSYGSGASSTSAVACQSVGKIDSPSTNAEQCSTEGVAASITAFSKDNDAESSESAGMAAQTVMAVATGCSINMEELERRRLFVPGALFHIKRLPQHKQGRISLPVSPGKFIQAQEDASRSMESKYVVVRCMDSKERFSRIIVSKTMISDHSCPRYIRGLSLALSSCPNS